MHFNIDNLIDADAQKYYNKNLFLLHYVNIETI